MNRFDVIGFALSNIWAQKLRTFLTLASIIIGALLIFLLPSLGLGASREIQKEFSSGDLKNVIVMPKYEFPTLDFSATAPTEPKLVKRLTYEDVQTWSQDDSIATVKEVHVAFEAQRMVFDGLKQEVSLPGADLSGTGRMTYVPPLQIRSVFPATKPENFNLRMTQGRYFTAEESKDAKITINSYIANGLDVKDPQELIGQTVVLTFYKSLPTEPTTRLTQPESKQYKFTVIGITQPVNEGNELADEFIPEVFMPFEQVWSIYQWQGSSKSDFASTYTFEDASVLAASSEAVPNLTQQFRDAGFEATSDQEFIKELQGLTRVIVLVLASIGLIALTVGALNIINTMMMAVSERTKEIGILRALGASRVTIQQIFLAESATIGFLGGAVGVFFGWIASLILNFILQTRFLNQAGAESNLPDTFFDYSPELILGVIGFVTLVGLLAGIGPAFRASRMHVVDSLRYE